MFLFVSGKFYKNELSKNTIEYFCVSTNNFELF